MLALAGVGQAYARQSAPSLSAPLGDFADATEAGGSGELSGSVASAGTGEPLAAVEVCAIESNAEAFTRCTITGSSGEYVVSGLKAAEYVVEFYSLSGAYVTQYYDGKSSLAASTKVAVQEGEPTTGIDAALVPAAEIAGQVTEATSGNTLENVKVCLLGSGEEAVLQCASTNAEGEYSIKRLPAGDYVVEFYSVSGDYGTQFYDGKYSFAAANRVAVSEGATAEGIDATLGRAGKITGTVTGEHGEPLEDVKVCAFDSSGESTQCASTKADGDYTLTRLSEGFYAVEFYSYSGNYVTEYYREKFSFAEANKVHVTGEGVTSEIDVALTSTGVISGTVTEAGSGTPIEDVKVCAQELGTEPVELCGYTGPDGEYAVKRLPIGEYVVEFSSPTRYLTQFYDGALSAAEAQDVTLASGERTASGIDAALVPIVHLSAPQDIQPPSIGGTPALGEALTCERGTWSGSPEPTFTYQWLREGAPIANANEEQYTVASKDQGHSLACEVKANNFIYSAEAKSFTVTALSAPVDVPSPASSETGAGGGGSGTSTENTSSTSSAGSSDASASGGVSAFTSSKAAIALAGRIALRADAVLVPLYCAGSSGNCPAVTVELTYVERTSAHTHKGRSRTVVVGRLSATLAAGKHSTLKAVLNAVGRKLLAKLAELPVEVRVTVGSTVLATRSLRFSSALEHTRARA